MRTATATWRAYVGIFLVIPAVSLATQDGPKDDPATAAFREAYHKMQQGGFTTDSLKQAFEAARDPIRSDHSEKIRTIREQRREELNAFRKLQAKSKKGGTSEDERPAKKSRKTRAPIEEVADPSPPSLPADFPSEIQFEVTPKEPSKRPRPVARPR